MERLGRPVRLLGDGLQIYSNEFARLQAILTGQRARLVWAVNTVICKLVGYNQQRYSCIISFRFKQLGSGYVAQFTPLRFGSRFFLCRQAQFTLARSGSEYVAQFTPDSVLGSSYAAKLNSRLSDLVLNMLSLAQFVSPIRFRGSRLWSTCAPNRWTCDPLRTINGNCKRFTQDTKFETKPPPNLKLRK